MTNAATGMPEKRTQTPSPSPDLIPAKTINRKLTLKLAHQMGALQLRTASLIRCADHVAPVQMTKGNKSRPAVRQQIQENVQLNN